MSEQKPLEAAAAAAAPQAPAASPQAAPAASQAPGASQAAPAGPPGVPQELALALQASAAASAAAVKEAIAPLVYPLTEVMGGVKELLRERGVKLDQVAADVQRLAEEGARTRAVLEALQASQAAAAAPLPNLNLAGPNFAPAAPAPATPAPAVPLPAPAPATLAPAVPLPAPLVAGEEDEGPLFMPGHGIVRHKLSRGAYQHFAEDHLHVQPALHKNTLRRHAAKMSQRGVRKASKNELLLAGIPVEEWPQKLSTDGHRTWMAVGQAMREAGLI